jgi:hypothetical protein
MSACYTRFPKKFDLLSMTPMHAGAGVPLWLAKAGFGWRGATVRLLEAERLDENISRTSQKHSLAFDPCRRSMVSCLGKAERTEAAR